MTGPDVAARLAELREAGTKLRRRPVRDTLEALARLLEGWRDPDSEWRRRLQRELPGATGFGPKMVREGLARGLSAWSGEALLRLVRDELGGIEALEAEPGFPSTALLLAGSIPMPSLLAMLAPLVLRSPLLVKSASRDLATPALVAESIAETDAELGRCVAVLDFPGGDAERVEQLLEADCVVAVGSDATVARVAERVKPPRRLVCHGHRLSMAAIGERATRGEALDAAARRVARDVALWDQLGCLSPLSLFTVGGDAKAADRVATAVAEALAEAERRWPRGRIEPRAAAAVAQQRAEAEMRAAAGAPVALHSGPGTCWTVVREADAQPRPAPLHRFLRVQPVADEAGLIDALRPVASHLAALGIAGFGDRREALARSATALGASRVCPLGELQSPPMDWRRDGRGVISPLARRTSHAPPSA